MISQGSSVVRLASFVNGNPFKPDDLTDEGYRVVRIRQLLDEEAEFDFAQPPQRPVFIDNGDLVFAWSATLAVRIWNRGTALLNQHLFRVDAAAGIDLRWLRYVLEVGVELLKPLMHGSAMTHITRDMLRSLTVRHEEISVQRMIADYLDIETVRIDALITKKLRMIDVSIERQVVSESASVLAPGSQVTAIPTIPTVPAGWRVLRNKVFMREVNAPSFDGTEEMLSVSHLTGVTPRSEKTVNMFEAESTAGYKTVQPGDLVINTMWAWMGAAGVARVSGIVSPAYGVYRIDPTIMTPDYFDIVVRTSAYITEMTRYSRGVTSSRLRLYPDEFLSLSSPVPPLEEQRRIVERCFAERLRTAALIERLERQVKLLREHRQALITAVITGDIEIPEVAA